MAGGRGNSCGSRRQTGLLVLLHSSSQTFPVPFPETTPRPVGALGGVQEFTGSTDGSGQLSLPSKDGDGEEAEHISSASIQLLLFLFFALFLKFIDGVCVCV